MPSSMLDQLWTSIADAGRDLVRGRLGSRRRATVQSLCRDLLSTKGEASGAALAREVVECYRTMTDTERLGFFLMLAQDYGADPERILAAVEAYQRDPSPRAVQALRRACEAPRHELFERVNTAPGGTRAIVDLRTQLLGHLPDHPELAQVDADLHDLLTGWFNPGFLTFTRIDWNSPASLLEKFLRYEKVHRMRALEDLKRRLAPDRRCFAFFHPALPDEPLIFVEVALVGGIADKVQPLIDPQAPVRDPDSADTAIFYSINNCLEGLRGVTLGNFLIKLVVADLAQELPDLKTYATLSPIPGFGNWLRTALEEDDSRVLNGADRKLLQALQEPDWPNDPETAERLRAPLLRLCAQYLVREKRNDRPRDPVARFHLGNGARLERVNWLGDISAKGLGESFGLLVNYKYDTAMIERNHEAYTNNGEVVVSSAVRGLLPAAG
ncbi:MAG TPA: malonyl-CoA decarboxylase [Geminicoccaceae bacterium]|nr:malonyl-CoA decarboxylase [Geminicoccaceae bacterium]